MYVVFQVPRLTYLLFVFPFVRRVKAFNAIPYYRDKVYDPDPDGSYTKAKLERLQRSSVPQQNVLDQTSLNSTCFNSFPPDESNLFSEDFSVLPSFVPMDAFEQVKNSGKSSKKSSNAEVVINSNDKGLRMMNFVHELQVYNDVEKNIIYLRACCWASYKRSVKYKVKLIINKRGTPKIQAAKCDRQCPASNSGCCCHIMAIIWKLENMTRNSELQNSTPDNRCCTSKPRQWGKGNKREVEFHPVMASTLVKPRHASDLPARKKRGIQSQFYDPRPPKFQNLDVDGILKLKHDLQRINPHIPFAVDHKSIPTVMTIVRKVAKGAIIHKQLQDFTATCTNSLVPTSVNGSSSVAQASLTSVSITSQTTEEAILQSSCQLMNEGQGRLNDEGYGKEQCSIVNDTAVPSHWQVPQKSNIAQFPESIVPPNIRPVGESHGKLTSFSQQLPQQLKTSFIETLTDEQIEVELATRGQSDNPNWFAHKQNKITASVCKDVFSHMNNSRSMMPTNLIKRITTKGTIYKQVSYSQAKLLNYKTKGLIYGIENEPVAANLYKSYLLSLPDVKEVTVQEVGLILDKDDTVLAASPDRIATIVYHNGNVEHRNVEIKCLESKQDVSPEEAIKDHQKEASFPFIKRNSHFEVKEKHKYWFQSQMQMGITALPLTDFVVFTSSRYPILVLKVTLSFRWNDEIKPSLLAFHEKYIKNKNTL